MSDLVDTAWQAAMCPSPTSNPGTHGPCGCCGAHRDLWPAKNAVSRNFTGYDLWVHPGNPWLCAACTWSFIDPALRAQPHQVTQSPSITAVSLTQVAEVLAAGPLPRDHALVVPLRPGRRHLLPLARWGHVCVDMATLRWTRHDAALLADYRWLRSQGFSCSAIEARAPNFELLRRCGPDNQEIVLAVWRRLHGWRCPDSPWLALASRISKEGS